MRWDGHAAMTAVERTRKWREKNPEKAKRTMKRADAKYYGQNKVSRLMYNQLMKLIYIEEGKIPTKAPSKKIEHKQIIDATLISPVNPNIKHTCRIHSMGAW